MSGLLFIPPTKEQEKEAIALKQEHFAYNETIINGSALWDQTDVYDDWLTQVKNNAKPETVQADWVESSTFFAMRKKDGKLVGMLDIRHRLNPFLEKYGGHIGYSVRSTERQKGYASEMLRFALDYLRTMGHKRVMLGCYSDNLPSINTILRCGGVLERELPYLDGKPMQVFWITL